MKLILLSLLIASPLAWYGINRWLSGFAYRTEINWTVFVLTAFLALILTLLTVSFQSIKAALADPVDSLRSE